MVCLEVRRSVAESGGMLGLVPAAGASDRFRVLCIGAHSDDIEIGCGGTLLQLQAARPAVDLHWVVFCASGVRGEEAARSFELFTGAAAARLERHEFRDGYLPHQAAAVKDTFEALKSSVQPDLIFTHWAGDAHQDHRTLSELTWNTFRNHLILEYEIPKYDGDLGRPNVFVPLEARTCRTKANLLLDAFASQRAKHWFDEETFLGLMRIRGMEAASSTGYAEAFYARKAVLSWSL